MLKVTKKSLLKKKHQFKKSICIQQLKVREDDQKHSLKMSKLSAGNEEETKLPQKKKIDIVASQRCSKQKKRPSNNSSYN